MRLVGVVQQAGISLCDVQVRHRTLRLKYADVTCGLSFDERMRDHERMRSRMLVQGPPVHNNPVPLLAAPADGRYVQMHEHIVVCVDLEFFLVGKPFLYW